MNQQIEKIDILRDLGWTCKLPLKNRYVLIGCILFGIIGGAVIFVTAEYILWTLIGFWIHLGQVVDPLLEILSF